MNPETGTSTDDIRREYLRAQIARLRARADEIEAGL